VSFKASDGMTVHGQLFDRAAAGPTTGAPAKRPAVIFVHGGPPRQMLVGWHYSDYYSNCYAINQYLASLGYVVLALNYRLGIGYGFDFHQPPNAGPSGASEYLDVKAAGEWLRTLPQVDASRIGIYGGSYGGFLTAMALARNSDIFAAGVDIHGVHDWTSAYIGDLVKRDRYEVFPDLEKTLKLAFDSSPVSSMSTWRSPVLLIHGDDDRNVRFNQTTDLVQRLAKQKVDFEQMVIPDDTHHWMRYANAVRADSATAAYLDRKLRVASKAIQ
jgi:dipeptidyl aminopeptidase/acylaminoacyl peptidase